MTVTGLFAGIGGFELGFSQAGFETTMLAESEPAAHAVLKDRFPLATLRGDVAELDTIPAGTTILTAGFPCQNLSMAGDKSGLEGSKSGVVEKMFGLIERSTVPIVVIENVNFMLHLGSGRAMLWLVEQFESLGYSWAYRVVDTMGFGLPHRRRRVYLVASRTIDPRSVLFADNAALRPPATPDLSTPLGFYWTEGRSGLGLTVDGIPPLKIGSAIGIPSPPAVLFPDGEVLLPSLSACERLQGFPVGWTVAGSETLRRGDRWRMIGNAVSVPVAHWVANRIKNPGPPLSLETNLLVGEKWPNAAWNVGEGRMAVSANDKPLHLDRESIATFRDDRWTRLSARALDGFIQRADQGNLRMPTGFLEALRRAPRAERKLIGVSRGARASSRPREHDRTSD
jgi:DNA (cytosine-5)-methyltransferase 1